MSTDEEFTTTTVSFGGRVIAVVEKTKSTSAELNKENVCESQEKELAAARASMQHATAEATHTGNGPTRIRVFCQPTNRPNDGKKQAKTNGI